MTCKDCVHYVVCWRVKEVETGNPMITEYALCRAFERELRHKDVTQVANGNWDWRGSDRWNDAYACSNCGKIAMDDSKYCPNCGAKMYGNKKEK